MLLLLSVVIAWRVVALWVERRRGAAGSRLHVRMVRLFSFVSVVPAIIVALASIVFFNFGMQSWLSSQVRTVLEESLAVAEAYLHEHKQNIRADALAMAQDLSRDAAGAGEQSDACSIASSTSRRACASCREAIVFDGSGAVRARSGFSYLLEIDPIPQNALEHRAQGRGRDPDRHRRRPGARAGAARRLPRHVSVRRPGGRSQGGRPYDEDARRGQRFERLEFQRADMQISFALVFVGIALVLLLTASWVGLLMASQLSRPLERADRRDRARAAPATSARACPSRARRTRSARSAAPSTA